VWNEPEIAQELGRERSSLEVVVKTIEELDTGVADARELLDMAVEEDDADTVSDVESDMSDLETQLAKLEFRRMFSGPMDTNNAFLEIQSGSGGTEAQDWAEMLLRMYLRWADDKGFKAELVECSAGEVAGIKSATVEVSGEYAFGWLRTEIGVHRLVRKSPFDSEIVVIPLLQRCLFPQKLMTTLTLKLTPLTCALILIAPLEPAVSISIKLIPQ